MTFEMCVRIASSASVALPLAIASTIAPCSRNDCEGRPGASTVRN